MPDAEFGHVVLVHEDHVAPAEHAPVAVVQVINGCVVLAVAPDRRKPQAARLALAVLRKAIENHELRAPGRRVPYPLSWRKR